MNAREPYPAAADTDGSRDGARTIAPKAGGLRDRVHKLLAEAGARGLTNPELSQALGLRDVTVWPRITELQRLHRVRPTGQKRRNPASGSLCTVYRCTTPEEAEELARSAEREARALRTVGPEARALAEEVEEAIRAGGLFTSRQNLETIAQTAIADAIQRDRKKRSPGRKP